MKTILAFSICAAALAVMPAAALTVAPLTFEAIVQQSTAIVYARVGDVRGQWTADRRAIESIVTLEALRYLKGDLGAAVPVRLPGGTAGGLVNVLPGVPVLHEGDLIVVFLGARGPAIPSPVGLTQGVFRVMVDTRTGAPLVAAPPFTASAAGRAMRGAAERRTLTLDGFATEVRAIAEAQR